MVCCLNLIFFFLNMEKLITIKNNLNSLDKLQEVLKKESIYECSI
jgi:hypothetical protein